jgi:hypothetical protein
MGRKATTPLVIENNVNHEALEEAGQAAQQLQRLQAGYGQDRDLANQLLGQAQAFQAAGNLLRTFGVSKLAIVKENKLYQRLSGMTAPNGSEINGTWAEYCGLLGISVDKADQDIANLQAFGEEALEQMQRAGVGYRDLRQFRKLPIDQRTALIQAAKEGDKDTLLELAEDLIAKHAKEKGELSATVEELSQDNAAKDGRISKKDQEIEKLKTKQSRLKPLSPDEEGKALLKETSTAVYEAEGMIRGVIRDGLQKLAQHAAEHDSSFEEVSSGMLNQLTRCIKELHSTLGIKEVANGDPVPAWAK